MTCSRCGVQNQETARFCRACGQPLSSAVGTAPTVPPDVVAAGYVPPQETSGKAIASLILGVPAFFFPASVAAIVLGIMARSDIKKSGGRLKGEGMALAGIILGAIGVLLIPVILIIAAIAIPNLVRAKITANETSALMTTRTIVTAELSYANEHPEAGYTCTLAELGAAANDPDFSAGAKHGYRFELTGCHDTHFQVVAYPETAGTTGVRAFCADETGIIRSDAHGSAEECLRSGTPLQ